MKLNVEELGKIGSSIAIQAWDCNRFYLLQDAVEYYHQKVSDAVNEKGGDADDCKIAQNAFLDMIQKIITKEQIKQTVKLDAQNFSVVEAALVYLRSNLDEYNDLFEDYDCITEKQVNDAMRQLGIWDNVGE